MAPSEAALGTLSVLFGSRAPRFLPGFRAARQDCEQWNFSPTNAARLSYLRDGNLLFSSQLFGAGPTSSRSFATMV